MSAVSVGHLAQHTMRQRARSVAAIATASLAADRRRTILSSVLDVCVGVAGPLLAVGTGLLVDAVAGRDRARVVVAVAVLAGAATLILALSALADRVRLRLEENVCHHLEMRVLDMVTGLPGIAHHERPEHLHRVDRLLEDSWLVGMAVPALILTVEAVLRFGLTIALLTSVDARLVLLPLGVLPTVWAGVVAEKIRLSALDARASRGRRADDIFEKVTDTLAGPELRTFGNAGHLIDRFRAAMRDIERDERNHRMRGGWRLALGRAAWVGTFAWGVLAVADGATSGAVSVGQLVTVVGLVGQVVGQATSVSSRLNWINWALTGVRHYVWLLDYDADHRGVPGTEGPPRGLQHGIRFEGVRFAYPGTDRVILDGVDLFAPAGSVIAIVGDNGAGKTTLVKLLLRLYEPTEGRITVDGVPLPSIDIDAWRSATTAALQDHTRPEVLLRESIGMGEVDRIDDLASVEAAAQRSGADAVARDLPGGFDAQLGTEWQGTELSGGQWQRLAVGRSAMREEPLLLVLDEPTAALDPEAEHALFTHYAGGRGGRANGAVTIVISHRLSTVRMADRIVVLADGRVAEEGTHAELLAAGDAYAELFHLQAAAYG